MSADIITRPGSRCIAELPPTTGGKWHIHALEVSGKTWLIALHPEHVPLVIDPAKDAEFKRPTIVAIGL